MLSASNNGWLSLCHYGSVQSALGLYPSSQRLADQLYLYAYNIGGKYYYCLYNQDSVNGVSVSLKMEKTSSSGEHAVITMSSAAPNYSIKLSANLSEKYDFEVLSIDRFRGMTKPPCLP